MLIKNDKGFYTLTAFAKYDKLVHGFSTVELGNLKGNTVEAAKNREKFLKKLGIKGSCVISADQIHGGNTSIVTTKNSGEKIERVGGLVTKDKGWFLRVFVAD